jgi:D-glycero-D-manno-heptose 1,7-bisphosphate phosphatase
MLLQAAQAWNIDLSCSYMVGDRWRDILAGRNAGCKTFLIDYAYAERRIEADYTAQSLLQATSMILQLEEMRQ